MKGKGVSGREWGVRFLSLCGIVGLMMIDTFETSKRLFIGRAT